MLTNLAITPASLAILTPPALLASATATGSASATTAAINTTGAALIVAAVTSGTTNPFATMSDSKSNAWTLIGGGEGTGSCYGGIYYKISPTAGTSHTFTATESTDSVSMVVAAFGTASITALDVSNSATSAAQPGSITPTQNGDLVVTNAAWAYGSGTAAINSGFAVIAQSGATSGYTAALAYLNQAVAAAVNPTWSGGTISLGETSIGAFKVSATGTAQHLGGAVVGLPGAVGRASVI